MGRLLEKEVIGPTKTRLSETVAGAESREVKYPVAMR